MSYRRLPNGAPESDVEDEPAPSKPLEPPGFSWPIYAVCALLGVAMLWAWNMFLAASPYFQRRFSSNDTILSNFLATEVSVFTLTNFGCMSILAKLQEKASYPRRIIFSLTLYAATYTLLAISTKAFRHVSTQGYFTFFIIMVLTSSVATGFIQNGTFAYINGFGRQEYIQGVMVGQAIAGILPPIVQIATVLSPGADGQQSSTSALSYFLTAVAISAFTVLAFLWLMRQPQQQHQSQPVEPTRGYRDSLSEEADDIQDLTSPPSDLDNQTRNLKKSIPFTRLARKLFYPATAVFINFAITMVFPVFTQRIQSISPAPPPLLRPAAFIPLAFLVWNAGDLLGRLLPLVPRLSLASRPLILLLLALLRLVFIPLYLLCNIQPQRSSPDSPGQAASTLAAIKSDWFYLLAVQFPFGLTNGFLGSCCMMGSGECVDEHEREAAGAYMGMLLVGGLTVGSLCSFFIGNLI